MTFEIMTFEEKLSKFDFETISINELENFFSKEISGHTRPTMKLWFDKLFRARIVTNENLESLKTTSSIWYPNWATIEETYHDFNRCSDVGQNFFYGSNYLEATIKEIRPNDGDLILIGLFGMKFSDVPAQSQFAGIERLKLNGQNKLLKQYTFLTKNDQEKETHISKIFRKRVPEDRKYEYKPSIAFTNILLKNDDIDCLVYPSVASNLAFENYGLKPKFVDDNMYCEQIYLYRASKDNSHYNLTAEKYGVIELNRTNPKQSSINWKDNDIRKEKIQLVYSI